MENFYKAKVCRDVYGANIVLPDKDGNFYRELASLGDLALTEQNMLAWLLCSLVIKGYTIDLSMAILSLGLCSPSLIIYAGC